MIRCYSVQAMAAQTFVALLALPVGNWAQYTHSVCKVSKKPPGYRAFPSTFFLTFCFINGTVLIRLLYVWLKTVFQPTPPRQYNPQNGQLKS